MTDPSTNSKQQQQQQQHAGPSKGRGRGWRSRRGGEGGRGAGGKGRKSNDGSNNKIIEQHDLDDDQWFVDALTSLGHASPSQWNRSYRVNDDASNDTDSDIQLQQLVVWLEDRWIRVWDIQRRNAKLRNTNMFWESTGLDEYLQELDCPYVYPEDNEKDQNDPQEEHKDEKEGQEDEKNEDSPHQEDRQHPIISVTAWKSDPKLRVRIVHWLLACATSEQYCDAFLNEERKDEPLPVTEILKQDAGDKINDKDVTPCPSSSGASSLPLAQPRAGGVTVGGDASADAASGASERSFSMSSFPLGFTTGDKNLDQMLTLLRMQQLVKLEHEEAKLNHAIADLQAKSLLQNAPKPLKSYHAHQKNKLTSSQHDNRK